MTERYCSICNVSERTAIGFNSNVENTDHNLCGGCAVEYQVNWRPKYSPVEPDVRRFVRLNHKV